MLLDDERTRITWRGLPAGDHRHEREYLTFKQSSCALLLQGSEGSENRVDQEDGRTISWAAPIDDTATNISDVEVRVLEIKYT